MSPLTRLYWRAVIEIRYQQRYFQEPLSVSIDTEDVGTTSGRVLTAKRRTSSISQRRVLDGVASAASTSTWPQPQSPTVDNFSNHPTTPQLIAKPTPASRRRQHPRYQPLMTTSEPEPNRTAISPLSPELAFPQLPTIASKKALKNTSGDTLPARSAWSRGPPPVYSCWSPSEQYSQLDPEPEPDSEAEPEPEPEPEHYPELGSTITDGREWKGKQRQTLLHGGDCSCHSCFPSLNPY